MGNFSERGHGRWPVDGVLPGSTEGHSRPVPDDAASARFVRYSERGGLWRILTVKEDQLWPSGFPHHCQEISTERK